MNTTPKDTTVRDLALELGQPISVTVGQISDWIALRTGETAYVSTDSSYRGDWVLSAQAADAVRMNTGTSTPSALHCGTDGAHNGHTFKYLSLDVHCPGREAAAGPEIPDSDPLELPYAFRTPSLRQVAFLLIRQDMTIADEGCNMWRAGAGAPDMSAADSGVLDWAVAVAGHLFDQHTLWDYGLVSNADHVHRCFTHRHDGPLTRGFRL